MNKLLLFFFVVLVVPSANSQLDRLIALFKNGKVPTMALLDSKLEETVNTVTQALDGISLPLPDVTKKYIDKNGETITVKLTEGQISGADTKFYVSDATVLTIDKRNVYIRSRFGNKKLILSYNYEFDKDDVVTKGTTVAEIEEFVYELDISLNLETLTLHLDKHRVVNEGEVIIIVDGQTLEDVAEKEVIEKELHNLVSALTKQLAANLIHDYNTNLK